MLNIIKNLLNYENRNSLDKLKKTKIFSLVNHETENNKKDNQYLNNTIKTNELKTLKMIVTTTHINENEIKTDNNPLDIFKYILNELELSFKYGNNYGKISIDNSNINNTNYLNNIIMLGTNTIYFNRCNEKGIVVLVPEQLKYLINFNMFNINIFVNPLPSNKIYIVSKPNGIVNCKFHLVTDSSLPNERELKINKIMGKENRKLNYSLIKTKGHNDSVVIINI